MPTFIERIPLDPEYSYLEIHADSLEELQKAAELTRLAYNARLHVGGTSAPFPSDKPLPAQGTNCATCNAVMTYREGVTKTGKNAGQPYKGYFCPNAVKGQPGHSPKWL